MAYTVHRGARKAYRAAKNLDFLLNVPIAHRGLFDECYPENSLGAFQQAAQAGLVSELDVQLTRDGHPVVFHDEELHRMTGHPGKVNQLTLHQLKKLRLAQTAETIPTLQEVVQASAQAKGLLVEIKSAPHMAQVSRSVWQTLQDSPFPWAVESFNPLPLLWFAQHVPKLPRGILIAHPSAYHPLQSALLSPYLVHPILQPDFWAYELRTLPNKHAQFLRRQGTAVLSWTVRTLDDWHKAKRYSDNLVFDTLRPPAWEDREG